MKLPRRQFLASGSGCCRVAGHFADRMGADLSDAAGALDRRFAAGGDADILARLIGQWLSEKFGRQFIIENRPGAASNIAIETAIRAPADGYTLFSVSSTNAINATLYEKLNFDLITDIAPVAGIVRSPNVLVVQSIVSGQDGSRVHRLCQG